MREITPHNGSQLWLRYDPLDLRCVRDFCSHGASDLSGMISRMPQTNLAVSGTSSIQGVDALARSTTLLDPVEEAFNDIAELWAETGPSPANEAVVASGVGTEHIPQLVSITLLRDRYLGRSTTETDFLTKTVRHSAPS